MCWLHIDHDVEEQVPTVKNGWKLVIPNQEFTSVEKANNFRCHYGTLKEIYTDEGKNFELGVLKNDFTYLIYERPGQRLSTISLTELLREMCIRDSYGTLYRPSSR